MPVCMRDIARGMTGCVCIYRMTHLQLYQPGCEEVMPAILGSVEDDGVSL